MLVQTWLETLMYSWGKIAERHSKKLERHKLQKAPLASPIIVEGNNDEKGLTSISK